MHTTDPKGVCSYCNEYVGRENVKTCGRCRLVRYCSKECQVAAWKTHKQRCTSDSFRDRLASDPEATALNAALTKWVNIWRFELHNWALCAMDLGNHSEDRLATHCLVIELERRPNPPNQILYFKMNGGDIMTPESVLAHMRTLNNKLDHGFVSSVIDPRGNDAAQIILVCEDLVRILWFSIRDGGASRQRDPALSRALSKDWRLGLMGAINTGHRLFSSASSDA